MSELPNDHRSDRAAAPDAARRHRRRSETRWDIICAITAVSAVAGAFAPGEPTGVAAFDVIERAAFAAMVALFAAFSRRWTWLVLAGVATVFAASGWERLLAVVALAFAVNAAWRADHRDRTTGALIGALSAQALLRSTDVGFFGFTALVTAVTVGVVVVSGYRTMHTKGRRRVRRVAMGLAAFVAIATAGLAYSTLRASSSLADGIASARQGLGVAEQSDQVGAANDWRAAHASFARADGILSSPLTKIAYPVPVLSQHARLAAVAASSGDAITATAAHAATVAPYQRLRAADGTFDLARITSMRKPVERTADAMIRARDEVDATSTPWLISPLRSRVDDYRGQLDRAIPRAQSALAAIQVAPELLGGNGKRHYLLLFANPAETRGLGGFIGAWAQLDADHGHLELVRHGKMGELDNFGNPATRTITGEREYVRRYGHLQPARYVQNISASPDFPTVARVAEQLYPQAGGVHVDGVMYIDPIALAGLLELTGPVTAQGVPMPLTAANAADFLMHDQYIDVATPDDRADLLSNAAQATFDALTHRELPALSDITGTMSPFVRQNRLMATVTDPTANRYLSSIGLTGAFPRPDGGDFVSVRVSNGSANKVDYFLEPRYAYKIRHDAATGLTTGTVDGTLENTAPTTGGPDYVFGNQDTRAGRTDGRPFASTTLQLSIYTALRPTAMTIDGHSVGIQVQHELGSWVSTQTVTIPAQGTAHFTLSVQGVAPRGRDYRVTLGAQPLARPYAVRATYTATDGPHSRNVVATQRFLLRNAAVESFTVGNSHGPNR